MREFLFWAFIATITLNCITLFECVGVALFLRRESAIYRCHAASAYRAFIIASLVNAGVGLTIFLTNR